MATKKTVKKAAKTVKIETTSTTKNVVKAASNINKQVQLTAGEVAKEVMENGKVVRDVATKAAKELNKKVDFDDSVKTIKTTADNVNVELKNVATEVIDVVLASGKQVAATATKAVKDTVELIDVEAGIETAKATAKNVNAYSLKTADEAIDGALKNGERWQKIATKAVNGGLKLAEKNQEMVFSTLEEVKGQLVVSAKRMRQLFSRN